MGTFKELHQKYRTSSFRKLILEHLIEHLESTFRSSGGNPPKKMLMTDEKVPVPDEAFEAVIVSLNEDLGETNEELSAILGQQLPDEEKPKKAKKKEAESSPTPAPTQGASK